MEILWSSNFYSSALHFYLNSENVDVEEELGNMKTNLSFHYQYKDPKTYLLHHFLSNQGSFCYIKKYCFASLIVFAYSQVFFLNPNLQACLGKRKCTVPQSYKIFGGDPCPGMPKTLLVDAQCE